MLACEPVADWQIPPGNVVSLNTRIWQFWSEGVAVFLKIDTHTHPFSDWKLPPQHAYIPEFDGYGTVNKLQPGDTNLISTQCRITIEDVVVEVVYQQDNRRGINAHHPKEFRMARCFIVPYWLIFPFCLGGAMFAHRSQYREFKQRRRIAAGLCANCGYDLRATPDRCPECGEVPAARK